MIYSPGRSLGFIRSSSIDIVSTSNTQQKNFYSTNGYEILSSGKVAPNINFATCAGAWSIRGYFRQLGTANNCVSNRGTLKCMFVQFLKLAWLFAAVFAVAVSRPGIEVTVGTQCVNSVKFYHVTLVCQQCQHVTCYMSVSTVPMLPVSTEQRACIPFNMWPVQVSPVLAGWVWDGVTGAAMELSPPAGGNILTLEMLLSVTSRGQYSHISHELPAPCRARRAVAPLTALRPVSGRARPRHGASPG